MFCFLFLAVLCASCMASPVAYYSFSPAVGGGSGTSYSTEEGDGPITGIRLWEINSAYIAGLQLRYGYIWGARVGRESGTVHELILYEGETIVQVSGKYQSSNYIYQLIFVTSRGRFLTAGQPTQTSFNFYPTHPDAELTLLSGRYNSAGLTSIAAHWAVSARNSSDTINN